MSESDLVPEVQAELVKPAAPPPHAPSSRPKPCGYRKDDWPRKIKDAELAAIRKRNATRLETELAGLAFSGGGIRSATFGLGVLEALKSHGSLRRFDYLSSVSGGGYISAWLTANCQRRPGWLDQCWKESIDHLRRFSNYLSPQVGFFSADTWSMLMVWVRNALLIQVTIMLGIALMLLMPRLFHAFFETWSRTGWPRVLTVLLFTIAVVGICANMIQLLPRNRTRQSGPWCFGACGWKQWSCVAVVFFLFATAMALGREFNPFTYGPVKLIAYPIAFLGLLGAFASVPCVLHLLEQWRGRAVERDLSPEVNYGQGAVQRWIVLPMIVTGFLLSSVLWGLVQHSDLSHGIAHLDSYGKLVSEAGAYWPFPLGLAFVSFVLIGACSLRVTATEANGQAKPYSKMEDKWDLLKKCGLVVFVSACCSGVLHLMLCGIALLMHEFKSLHGASWHAFAWGTPLLLLAFSLAITLLIGLMGRASLEGMREWWARLAAWLCIYAGAWSLITMAAVYGPAAVGIIANWDDWKAVGTALGWVAATVGGLFAANSTKSDGESKIRSEEPTKTSQAINAIAILGPYVFIAGLLVGVATLLEGVLWVIANEDPAKSMTLKAMLSSHWTYMEAPGAKLVLTAAGATLIALLIMAARVGINEFSLNAFYRNRLVRCYLGATRDKPAKRTESGVSRMRNPQNFTNFDDDDDLRMSDISCASGPFHLVNCAMNLGGSSDLSLHTRHSASFTISPTHIGSTHLTKESGEPDKGYRAHADCHPDDQVMLGQAIAVSGAAASPNMGYHTSPAVAFLLTVFNVRLGWWFPNPVSTRSYLPASPLFSLRYLLLELFGVASEKSDYLMISDGGHFENLAVYELIRRKCKLIVASDAECDEGMRFEGLGTLIRMCEVDFGARITIDTSELALRPKEDLSPKRFALGDIQYADGSEGVLIYLKAAMDGTEDASVRQYKATHQAFPHESTGDQFYGEDQFESYRRLGYDIAQRAFAAFGDDAGLEHVTPAQRRIFDDIFPTLKVGARSDIRTQAHAF